MKRKIFLLYPYYWPHYKAGGPVQSLFNLSGVLRDNASFFVLSKLTDIDGASSGQRVKSGEWNLGPNDENVFYTKRISPVLVFQVIKEIKPDVILINGMFNVLTTIPGILVSKLYNAKMVISPRGMLQQWGLERGKLKKRIFLKLLKLFLRKNEEWHATDEKERTDILRIFGTDQVVHVAPNIPRKISDFTFISFPRSEERIKLVFLSLIGPNKNLHLIIDAVIHSEKFTLDIFGPVADDSYWQSCQKKMAGFSTIEYRGPVPPWNIQETLRAYHFFVLPTQGENFGHAIFDALSSSVPVIISKNTPWMNIEQIGAGFYVDLERGNDLQSTLHRISSMTEKDYQTFRTSAHNYAKQYWDSSDYLQAYQFLLKDPKTVSEIRPDE